MRYISTRGGAKPQAFSDILLEGLAPDGGLYLPDSYPQIPRAELARLRPLGYRELALEILSRFIDDIPREDLKRIIDRTYTARTFGSEDITPVKQLEPGLYLLQLSNGPTLAFKDIALQLLGNLFEYVLEKRGETLNVLGATSGDTGSAAEYALRGKQNVRVFMLSPHGRMSPFQAAQMYSLPDANIFNIAVRGVFDDCQDIVKAVSGDAGFKAAQRIGSVNSINWARLLAQVVYYFKGYFAVTRSEDELVSFSVPSGNFGNVCAGHIARMMGLPVKRLIVASNENDVLDVFFRSGRYRPRSAAEIVATSSPSMDISRSSNFERFVFDLAGRDPEIVADLWRQLADKGEFDLSRTPHFARVQEFGFVSGASRHADRIATIREVHGKFGYVIDTHTADGVKVGLAQREAGVPLLCLETALAAKFEEAVREAIGRAPARPAGLENLEKLPQRCEVMNADVAAIKRYIARHAG